MPQLDADWPELKQWPDTEAGRWMAGFDREQRVRTAAAKAEWEAGILSLRDRAAGAKRRLDELVEAKAPFSQQVAARQAAAGAFGSLRNAQENPPPAHRASVPTRRLGDVGEGMARVAEGRVEVFQTVERGALVRVGGGVVYVEMSTRGLIDGRLVSLKGVAEGLGTRRYDTVIGGTNTVPAVRLHDVPELAAPAPIPPQLLDPLPNLPVPRRDPVTPPPGSWSSKWEQVGKVKARVAGADFALPPLVDAKGDRTPGPEKVIMVWVELENVSGAVRGYKRYQQGAVCSLAGEDRAPHFSPTWPPGLALDDASTLDQKLQPSTPATTLIVFRRPAAPTGELYLTLDASRVGEPGRFLFRIPATAWQRSP